MIEKLKKRVCVEEEEKSSRPLGIKRREQEVRREAVLPWVDFSLRGDLLPLSLAFWLLVVVELLLPKDGLVINVSGSIFHQERGGPHLPAKEGGRESAFNKRKEEKGGRL